MENKSEFRIDLDLMQILNDQNLADIYANGFVVYRSNSDVGIILRLDNKPVGKLHLSFTLAKSLAEGLKETIGDIETATKQSILTTNDIETSLKG